MKIRKATVDDLEEILQLFTDTIMTINASDYTSSQLNAWLSGALNAEGWKNRISEQHFIVAENERQITGFASVSSQGYVDLMFVHKDFQKLGIARQLMANIQTFAVENSLPEIWSDVSITAVPFFIKSGFLVDYRYEKSFGGSNFRNTIMRKKIML